MAGTPNCVLTDDEPYFWGDITVPENVLCSALTHEGMSYRGLCDIPGLQIVGPCEDGKPLHAIGSCTVTTSTGAMTIFCAIECTGRLSLDINNATVSWGMLTNQKDWDDSVREKVAQMKNSKVIHLRHCVENVARKEDGIYRFADNRVM